MRVWDLDSQHCCQTLGGHKAEVWSLDVSPSGSRVVTGASDNEIRVFAVRCAACLHVRFAGVCVIRKG